MTTPITEAQFGRTSIVVFLIPEKKRNVQCNFKERTILYQLLAFTQRGDCYSDFQKQLHTKSSI